MNLRKLRIKFRDIRIGISNLIKWLPIIWKDRDWDDGYILKVLKFKIDNTRDQIIKNNIICDDDQKRIKKYTTLCSKLIEHSLDETYLLEYLDYDDNNIWAKEEQSIDTLKEYFAKYPHAYRKALQTFDEPIGTEIYRDRVRIALRMALIRQNKANSIIWKILEKEIYFWWD